jgi:hypothetical protein
MPKQVKGEPAQRRRFSSSAALRVNMSQNLILIVVIHNKDALSLQLSIPGFERGTTHQKLLSKSPSNGPFC